MSACEARVELARIGYTPPRETGPQRGNKICVVVGATGATHGCGEKHHLQTRCIGGNTSTKHIRGFTPQPSRLHSPVTTLDDGDKVRINRLADCSSERDMLDVQMA